MREAFDRVRAIEIHINQGGKIMGWLNFGGKKRKEAQGFGNSPKRKGHKKSRSHVLERIVTPSAGVGGWLDDLNPLHQLFGSLSLPDLDLPNFLADSGVCPIDPSAPTNNLPPLIDFDPLGLYNNGIATQTPYNPGGAFETLPIGIIPVDPHAPNPNNPNAIRQLLNFPLANQPLLGSIDTGVSADSPYLNYANIKKGRDYVGGDDNPLLKAGEGSEHGTFMLGIIDAINKTAPKWVGRAIDSGRWADSLVEFVDAAKASGQKNAIANLSLDLTQKNADGIVTTRYELTTAERSAIEYARQNGVMLVVAAGNDGGVMSVLGQASQEFDNIFTVGAGDINGRSNYSSYGRGLDIVADGGTTEHPGLSTVGNDLGTMAGTSVATAKVAGAASLVWAANPALNYRQVMEILKSTARDLGPSGWDDETGFGFLNTLAAVDLAKKTKPEVYKPTAFLKPTTWGGEGLVTPTERAVNIINENFTAWVVSSNGITLRNSPNTSDRSNFVVKTGDTLSFDGWTYGEQLSDLTTGKADALWYRFRYNGGTYWVPSAWTGGYPGSKPPLLPPTQQPPQQPPQQPTANTVYLSTSSGQILQVNTATGAQNSIYQGRAFTDLAVAPNGKLYGCTFYDGLYEINPSTGAERYVGPLAGGSLNSLTFSTDGRLYGADHRDGNLFQISPDNGQMNLIGNLGGPSSGDLVFNGANEILATVSSPNTSLNDRLVAVNLATGNSRYIGDLGLLEVYGLSWENGQLTAYTSDRRKLAIDPNTAKATVVGTVSSNGLIWGAATKPATASSPTDDVRQKFLYAASQYPQVGAAITGMQDQGGGVFRQEFERAIMIWNGQQVTVYETKGRSASTTSPSSTPTPVSGKGNTIRTGAADPNYIQQLQKEISDIQNEIKKQTARITESKNFIDVLGKEKTDLSSLITTKEDRIKKIKEDWFWWFNSDKRQEISQLDEIIKQAEGQQKWDQENINYWNSQKTDAELQANQKRTALQQKETELQKLTFTGTVNNDAPPVRNMPTDVGNSPLNVVFKKGENLTFGGWTVDNKGRKWFRIVDSEERWIWEQNIDLNGDLPESLKVQPPSGSSKSSQTALFTTDIVFQMFPIFGYVQTNIKTYLPLILSELEKVGLGDRDMVLMALATIRAETESFKPIGEEKSSLNTSPGGAPFDLYDFDTKTLKLGNNGVGIGAKYKGRGFIQLTGKENYQKRGKEIGIGDQLVNNPEQANDPILAAKLLARFIKNKESAIRQALGTTPPNYSQARTLVNGGSHGLEQFTQSFKIGANLTA
ncbi:MAG: S8 family serine peptidase [Microcoleus sp. PH2017_29_MFU_D_A]|uniref:S8 family serine peptidase n=1 Tax=unclassified Microcoleus TaxID=2642155 RepID=UPI001DCD1B14|nr:MULTISPECIES: S8 family serine peptidase [unclassified Microcoleus]MCC3606279.1 S8 family serine peptidase [Microcoleus sp. PH2017_29_MFU_D_A]MCC3637360.1 S8 family serine peptidase [Microcoleus sp. PH2017_37_MFU_D_B]TAE09321.1 MAG: DUF4394 domain-containing protein [Oscillatoriales cyanobacterium]TAE20525.1 MAG: DUF4394 domain-containing protein [Oscillatoriales cyanobacterium]